MSFDVENIHKRYGNNHVLTRFNFSFNKGLYLVRGINGIGKSTLLKILARVCNPTNVNYIIEKKKVAFLCEKVELANIKPSSFLNTICKINNTKFNIEEDLKNWKIPDRNICTLSKGNKQKVSLLMMKYTTADIYLFDEPTDSLDECGIKLFISLVSELISNSKIILISTHEPSYFTKLKYKEVLLCSD